MKPFSFAAAAAALLASAVVTFPFALAQKEHAAAYLFRVTAEATVRGDIQLFRDDGQGIREDASERQPIAPGTVTTCDFRLPAGVYHAFRLDPLDRTGNVRVRAAEIVDAANGRRVRTIDLAQFKPNDAIASARVSHGGLEVVTTADGNDPQLTLTLAEPLALAEPAWAAWYWGWARRSLLVFLCGLVALAALSTTAASRAASALARGISGHPTWAIVAVAAVALVVSAYPVVFLGRSYVSPDTGTPLLYSAAPALPGYRSVGVMDSKGSDVGAIMWQHVPYAVLQRDALRAGELPLWNRYNSLGNPLLGQGQSMFGDPLQLIPIVADGAAWSWDVKYLAAKTLFATAIGLCVLLLANSVGAALLATVASVFVGFFAFRFNHPAFFSVCYSAWILYVWLRVTTAERWARVTLALAALVAVNGCVMASGTVKEAYMLLFALNATGAAVLLASPLSWRQRLLRLGAAVLAGAFLVALTAPLWLTFLGTLRSAHTAYEIPLAFQLQPSLLLGAWDELFFRPLSSTEYVFNPSLNLLLALGVVWYVVSLRSHLRDRRTVALGASACVPAVTAFGVVPPQWITALPFIGNIQHIDNCMLCVLVVLGSVLGGVGFARAWRRLQGADVAGDVLSVALIFVAVIGAWIGFRQAVHHPVVVSRVLTVNEWGHPLEVSPFIWGYLGVAVAALAVLVALAWRAARRGTLGVAGGVLAGLCVVLLLWRFGLHTDALDWKDYVTHPKARADFHARSEAVDFLRAEGAREPMRVLGADGALFAGWTGLYGIEGVSSVDALTSRYVTELLQAIPGWSGHYWPKAEEFIAARPYLDALNVRFYAARPSDAGALQKAGLSLVRRADLDVYESRTVWPRAFFTDRIRACADLNEFLAAIRTGDGRPFAAVEPQEMEEFPAVKRLVGSGTGIVSPARTYVLGPNETACDVDCAGAGLVVLTESYWRGDFRAFVDGVRVPIVRVNHAFKAVRIDAPGRHHVVFRYLPRGFPARLEASAVAAVLGVLIVGFALARERRRLLDLSHIRRTDRMPSPAA